MSADVISHCKQAMEKRIKGFENELKLVRTGRASITILDPVRLDYYGTPTPLNQVATLTTPDARTIVIAPFEKRLIQDIEKAIMIADVGVQPTNDGNVVRLPFPALTEERRKDIAKSLKKMAEESRVGIRNIRRDVNEDIKTKEKNKVLNEDDSRKLQADVQKMTDQFIKQVDDKLAAKEKEVMTI
ncbi:MAG: ribosome recycling factor [Proteobacteria bacterium]|nr:ribosome recycling factor [Pseudomonadota bacterium]